MATPSEYIPERGEIIWAMLEPPRGEWRVGRSLALVLSLRAYNEQTGLVLLCPIVHQGKGGPFEATLPAASAIQGVLLVDRVRSVAWEAAAVQRAGVAPAEVVQQTLAQLRGLLT